MKCNRCGNQTTETPVNTPQGTIVIQVHLCCKNCEQLTDDYTLKVYENQGGELLLERELQDITEYDAKQIADELSDYWHLERNK